LFFNLLAAFLSSWTPASRSGFSGSDLSQKNGDLKSDFKQVKENTLFNVNSCLFNLENNKEEVQGKYNCFYNPALEALCILIEEGTKYTDLSKDIVMNLMDFAQRLAIKNIVLLLDRKNRDYVKILQGMMTVGFSSDANNKMAKVGGKDYKVLKMTQRNQEEIEEIVF
jgi:hypothetical protein